MQDVIKVWIILYRAPWTIETPFSYSSIKTSKYFGVKINTQKMALQFITPSGFRIYERLYHTVVRQLFNTAKERL